MEYSGFANYPSQTMARSPMPPPAPSGKHDVDAPSVLPGEVAVVIPARLGSTRLPNKPMAVIGDAPMIVQVWRRASEAGFGQGDGSRLVVACDDKSIADAVLGHGGEAVLTRPDHPSGSDRVHEALDIVDPGGRIKVVVNLQGDLPEIDASILWQLVKAVADEDAAIATPVAPLAAGEMELGQVVKAVVGFASGVGDSPEAGAVGRALAFTRNPDSGKVGSADGGVKVFHHVGIYAWRREALARFVGLPPSPLEQAERLEQLRALEDGMEIAAVVVDSAPGGIDTPGDLDAVRRRFDESPSRKA